MRIASIVKWVLCAIILGFVAVRSDGRTSGAEPDLKSAVSAAVQKLAGKESYAWSTTVVAAEGEGPLGNAQGATTGRTEKGGYTYVMLAPGDSAVRDPLG